jgi:hypothetical protein
LKSEIVKNRRLFGVLELFSRRINKRLTYYRYVICEILNSILYTVWEEIDFAVWKMSPCYDTVPIGVMVKNSF